MIEQVVLGREAPPSPAAIAWRAPSPAARDLLVGVYDNETTFEIAMRDGRLVLLSGESVGDVRQGADNLFEAPIMTIPGRPVQPLSFGVESSRNRKARHIRIGSRVWVRLAP